nr:uncharacterized protein LOC120963184 [Aegilops tauschii subsp. strangulata]
MAERELSSPAGTPFRLYLYWEKVQPLEGECAFNPSLSMEPLMRNWTEAAASRRDKFDYDDGRGRGNIKRLLEKLNQNGVMYKPAAAVASGNNDADLEVDSFENEPDEPVVNQNNDDEEKTPAKLNVDKTTKPTDECGTTPENPWIVGNSPRAESSDIDISASSIDRMVGKSKGKKSAATAKEDDVISGKRRRTVPKKFESLFKLDKPGKQSARALFSDNDVEGSVKDDLTPELIDVAVTLVEAAARSEKNMTKRVYYNERGISVTVESIRPIIRHIWLCALVMIGTSVQPGGPNTLLISFIPLNVGNTHWITVVMHNRKKEFRVFDSLYPLEFPLDTVKALRLAIAIDMEEANRITPGKYPDVTKWPIIPQIDMPLQEDGNSCGLFVIEVMEHWDGDRWTADFTQGTVNARRRRLVAELVLSPTNTLECVKNKIRDIAKKSKA